MTADVRQQLTEALDEAERLAKGAGGPIDGGRWTTSHGQLLNGPYVLLGEHQAGSLGSWALAHICRWDPVTVLRLVEYFRTLLADHAPDQLSDDLFQCDRCGHFSPCPDVEAAAAFWLGTPEADR